MPEATLAAPGAPAAASPGSGRRALPSPRAVMIAAVAVGIALRLIQYLGNRSLWMDEALLVDQALSAPSLTSPLYGGQVAPVGYLLLLRVIAWFSTSELALRLPSLLAGAAALALFPAAARRWVDDRAAAWGAVAFAAFPYAVYFSSEVKQYALDTLVVTALLLTAPGSPRERRPLWPFVAVGALGVWVSQPSVFLLGGLTLAALVARRDDLRGGAGVAGGGLVWLVSFAGAYLLGRRQVTDLEFMQAWWEGGFPPVGGGASTVLRWLGEVTIRFFRDPLGRYDDPGALAANLQLAGALLATGLGCWALARRRRGLALALAATAAALLFASVIHAFPLGNPRPNGGRVLLFLMPAAALVLGAGIGWLHERSRGAGFALGALALGPLAWASVTQVPHGRAEIRPLVEYLAAHRRPGDVIYVYYQAGPAFEYYAARTGLPPAAWTPGRCARQHPEQYVEEVRTLPRQARVWVLFSGGGGGPGSFDEKGLVLGAFRRLGQPRDRLFAQASDLYLFDLTATPPAEVGPLVIPRFVPRLSEECRGTWEPLQRQSAGIRP